jgi:hypothetical protein
MQQILTHAVTLPCKNPSPRFLKSRPNKSNETCLR